jgi:TetR/AcrR family transcriptional regulator, transcriptional repressor for nem operon
MPHAEGRKEEGRKRVLTGAARGFRRHGYGGLGVDGLAKEAGVTSGGFYAHFRSKSAAFRDVVASGMGDLRQGIERLRTGKGSGWRTAFVDFYLGERLSCDLADSCALQSLTTEVARADADARDAYTAELRSIIEAATVCGDGGQEAARADAIAMLALLSGGVSIARAVSDPALAQEIARAVHDAALRV